MDELNRLTVRGPYRARKINIAMNRWVESLLILLAGLVIIGMIFRHY